MRVSSFLLAGLLLTAALPASAQTPSGAMWADISDSAIAPTAERVTVPQAYRTVRLDRAQMSAVLAISPTAQRAGGATGGTLLSIPLPEGGFVEVRVVEASIMAPELQAQFPEIRTYLADGPGEVHGRLSDTPLGFHGMLFAPGGTIYIDPYAKGDTENYIVYRASDLVVDPASRGRLADEVLGETSRTIRQAQQRAHGDTKRTYRLAVAATGEYTAFHGGTVAFGLAGITATINRVTGIYERDLSVGFQLIANNNLIVYTNAATDPYTNNSGVAMLGQNQINLDAVIGTANYDVGHVFSTGGGGVASLGVICNTTSKARGVTGLPSPIGDVFDVDFVAHEMGHQFAGNHTFNGDSGNCAGGNRNGPTAYEPGSGSTIQAYAGICGNDNLQTNSDAYFHGISLDEITTHVTTGTGGSCGIATATGNTIPTVDAGADYTIPARTPFMLTGSATDDTPGSLTYIWEEFDLGPQADVNAGLVPYFRSFLPTASGGTRVFPQMSRLLAGQAPVVGEALPTTSRTLNFRLTARDNRAGAGAINDDAVQLTTVDTGAPFAVTFASTTGQSFPGTATVTWNVSGTTAAPISAANVEILFSDNNGASFDHTLALATPNDGSQPVIFPVATSQGRILIRGSNNIFFNVNPQPFTTTAGDDDPIFSYFPGSLSVELNTNEMATETVTISNDADPGAADLTWSASIQNSAGPSITGTPTTTAARTVTQAPAARATPQTAAAEAATLAEKQDDEVRNQSGTASLGSGSPDTFGNTWTDSDEVGGPAFAWADISATGTAVTLGDDASAGPITLPFAFPFYGVNQSSVFIGSNGLLSFGAGSSTLANQNLPSTTVPNNLIAMYWDDLNPTAGGSVRYQDMGDGRFVVQFTAINHFGSTAEPNTFQAILHDNGQISLQYLTMTEDADNLNSQTVGIENAGGTDALQMVFNAAYMHDNLAVQILPPGVSPWEPPPTFVSVSPTSGTVAPGASEMLDVDFDATGLADGTYTADLVITTNDPANPTATIPLTMVVGGTAPGSTVVNGSPNWYLMGSPTSNTTVDDLALQNLVAGVPGYYPTFGGSTLLTSYDGSDWVSSVGTGEIIESGQGFLWYFFDDVFTPTEPTDNPSSAVAFPITLSAPGAVNTADADVTLHASGNRINVLGNPFGTPLDVTDVANWPGGAKVASKGRVFVWDPDLATWLFGDDVTTVGVWQGFAVRGKRSASGHTLTIPASAASGGASAKAAPEGSGDRVEIAFTLDGTEAGSTRRLADRALRVTFGDDGAPAWDDGDAEKLAPLADAYVVLGALGADENGETVLKAAEHRALTTGSFEVPLALETAGADAALTLRWPTLANLPPHWEVTLRDVQTGEIVDLRRARSHTFTAATAPSNARGTIVPVLEDADASGARTRFVLRVVTGGDAAALEPLALQEVRPNPVRENALVAFTLPEADNVTVTVVDVRGREVARLAEGSMDAGRHELLWWPSSVASGVYVIRLATGDAVLTRRAVVVR